MEKTLFADLVQSLKEAKAIAKGKLLRTVAYLRSEAAQGKHGDFERFLTAVTDVETEPADVLPPGKNRV
ncbi:MAG: hypothetical protein ACYC2W_06550 [Desulfurivibrionaceae bacterium]